MKPTLWKRLFAALLAVCLMVATTATGAIAIGTRTKGLTRIAEDTAATAGFDLSAYAEKLTDLLDVPLTGDVAADVGTLLSNAKLYNVLIVGVDSRQNDYAGRSDAMVVLTVNPLSQKVVMTSLLRDSYVDIPGHGQERLNEAYNFGGTSLLKKTIRQNYGIRIDAFMVVNFGDLIEFVDDIGGVEMTMEPISAQQVKRLEQLRTRGSSAMESISNLLLLSIFQALSCMGFLLAGSDAPMSVIMGYGGIMALQWALLGFYLILRRPAFELETVAFLLCSMGMAAICAVCPGESVKQLVALALGIGVFLVAAWSMRDLERAKKMRYVAAVAGIGLLAVTLLFGKEYYGAKNWLVIGSFSIQPSELAKVCFVYVGASAMERIMNKRNIIGFIVYTLAVCGCLALMNDFGTALIFFFAFLMIAYLRSGSFGTVALALTALGFAGVIGVKLAPHALRRFASWRHIWDAPLAEGYQQTRALMCIASGGFFGLGIGRGWMKNLFAADSDMVFATLAEEWGLIMPLLLVVAVICIALFAVRCAGISRSSFYTIGAITAGTILIVQTIFNVLGTLDVLPLTGVTMPFVSNGGSSMICSWGLLAFIKAADTRKFASFAVRRGQHGGMVYE